MKNPRNPFLLSRRGLFTGMGAGLLAPALAGETSSPAAAIDMSTYQPTSTFAHLAYGPVNANGAYWNTSFVFMNYGSAAGSVQILTWSPSGTPLAVPVVGGTTDSQHTVSVPAGGSVVVALDQTAATDIVTGWVGIVITGSITGQGIFKLHIPGQPDFEAAVPLLARTQAACVIPFPVAPTPVLGMPFDNTSGYVTSVAFANTAAADRTLDLEFVDNSGASIFTAHESLPAHNQKAFETPTRYTAVANKQGWMHIQTNVTDFTALGFRFNPNGPFTTWLPVLV
jgi:hypothetical protein